MKRQVFPFLMLLFCITGIKKAEAQQNTKFITDSLLHLLSLKKTAKDSLYIMQQLADSDCPIDEIDYFGKTDYITPLLALNSKIKLIDPAPYLLLQKAMALNKVKRYKEEITTLQSAVFEFDKQHKTLNPILIYIRLLYNATNDLEGKFKFFTDKLEYYQVNGPVENTAACYHGIAGYYSYRAAYNQAISNYLKSGEIYRKFNTPFYANEIAVVGEMYTRWGNYDKALYYLQKIALQLDKRINDSTDIAFCYYSVAGLYLKKNQFDPAIANINEAIGYDHDHADLLATFYSLKGLVYLAANKPAPAYPFLKRAKAIADSGAYPLINPTGQLEADYGLYKYYHLTGNNIEAEKHILDAEAKAVKETDKEMQLKYLEELGTFYKTQNKPDLASKYLDQYLKLSQAREESLGKFKVAQYEIDQNDKQQKQHIDQLKQEKAIQDYEIRRRNVLLVTSFAVILLIIFLSAFIYRQLVVNKKTLISLRQTQRQLIQSEKMASLGELTAGIAHEIQNPLNFVNNFSEVSVELIEEMETELKLGQTDEALEIAEDVKQNLEKIRHHGKRADGIVKGMLQHSRASSNQKEPTDINDLANEYLRLAYHGLRAKDKSFNAELGTHFDEKLPKIDVVPQDIGRVILNLLNNAFYAIQQKAKTAGPNYKPTVEITTRADKNNVTISVKDNGTGIPDAVKEKIMQPFYTTKPTGEGTGLGLSLSYDIVVKGHRGKINIVSKEGEGSEFIIDLPIV